MDKRIFYGTTNFKDGLNINARTQNLINCTDNKQYNIQEQIDSLRKIENTYYNTTSLKINFGKDASTPCDLLGDKPDDTLWIKPTEESLSKYKLELSVWYGWINHHNDNRDPYYFIIFNNIRDNNSIKSIKLENVYNSFFNNKQLEQLTAKASTRYAIEQKQYAPIVFYHDSSTTKLILNEDNALFKTSTDVMPKLLITSNTLGINQVGSDFPIYEPVIGFRIAKDLFESTAQSEWQEIKNDDSAYPKGIELISPTLFEWEGNPPNTMYNTNENGARYWNIAIGGSYIPSSGYIERYEIDYDGFTYSHKTDMCQIKSAVIDPDTKYNKLYQPSTE